MSLSAITQPYYSMAAYSAVPLRLRDDNFGDFDNYKYLTNIVWDNYAVNEIQAYVFNGLLYTKCTTTTPHNYQLGDELLIDGGTNNANLTGYYFVVKIIDANNFVINRVFEAGITSSFQIYKVISYQMPPDIQGEAKLDLSNTLKNYCTDNLKDVNEIFEGTDTRFGYRLRLGCSYDYVFQFNNLIPTGNTASFFSSAATINDVELNVGDMVQITVNPIEWDYDFAYNTQNYLAFSGSSAHGTPLASTFNVTGQISNPNFNGIKQKLITVQPTNAVISTQIISFTPPQEPGTIYFYPPSNYNTTATVTQIVDNSPGVTIFVSIDGIAEAFGWDAQFGGEIRKIGGASVLDVSKVSINNLNVFSTRFKDYDYTMDAFDKFAVQPRAANLNFLSTILKPEEQYIYDIQKDTKSWLLCHTVSAFVNRARYDFFDGAGILLGASTITNVTSEQNDFYMPIGLDQILASNNRQDIIGDLTAFTNDIVTYRVSGAEDTIPRTNYYRFRPRKCSTSYTQFKLMWKDSGASWLSMIFNLKSYDEIEVERNTYYKQKGRWNNDTFSYEKFDRGEEQYFTRSRKKYTLNTDWLSDEEVRLVEDMFESAKVFIQDKNGELVACVIDLDTIELYKSQNEELFQYEFIVRESTNNYRF